MKNLVVVFGVLMAINLAACATPENRAAKAEAAYTEEKTDTLKEYKKCVDKSVGDEAKMARCEAILKAVQAVEGGK